MFDWLETPAFAASLGLLFFGVAALLATVVAVSLAVASMWMKPPRADRALDVLKELRRLVSALRGSRSSG